ncbi:GerAB/ArcD/ProY family transporter [Desulforamulus putei]|uniref:GerAB/ArcD/ProY family transporter n=1 Tax=Desulforamulus putei TaxID=74701 RepID=UPI001EE43647|nr:GerAB/ArcD/ProY family transporter [Desulforamulus putei]
MVKENFILLREGKIGFAEGFSLLYISSLTSLFLTLPSKVIEDGKNMAWLLFLITIIMVLLAFWIVSELMRRQQDMTLIEATETLLGPYVGMLVNTVFFIYFVIREALLFREYAEAFLVAALPRTPISVVIAVLVVAAFTSAYYGLETIARAARAALPFVVVGLVTLYISVLPYVDTSFFYPLWLDKPLFLLGKAFLDYTSTSELIASAVIIHSFGGWQFYRRIGFLTLAAAGGTILITTVLILFVFGVQGASELILPFFNLSQIISIGRFFQRLESVFLLTWAMVGFFKIALFLYISTVILARMFRLADYRPLLWIVTLLCLVLSILPPDLPTTLLLDGILIGNLGLIPTVLLPFVLLLVSWVKRGVKE